MTEEEEKLLQDAEEGDVQAQNDLGIYYLKDYKNSLGEVINKKAAQNALNWFSEAASHGYAESQYNLAWMYDDSSLGCNDLNKFHHWMQKSSDQNYPIAQYYSTKVSPFFTDVIAPPAEPNENFFKAMNYANDNPQHTKFRQEFFYRQLSAQGAIVEMRGPPYHHYVEAAKQGEVWAQLDLGLIYLNGDSVAIDYQKAFYWFSKAAEQGDVWAQKNIGLMYLSGKKGSETISNTKMIDQGASSFQIDLVCDLEQAFNWFNKAAINGHKWSQYKVGEMYLDGQGVERNDKQGMYWIEKVKDKFDNAFDIWRLNN